MTLSLKHMLPFTSALFCASICMMPYKANAQSPSSDSSSSKGVYCYYTVGGTMIFSKTFTIDAADVDNVLIEWKSQYPDGSCSFRRNESVARADINLSYARASETNWKYSSVDWVSKYAAKSRESYVATTERPSPTSVRVSGYGHMPERVAKGCAVSQPAETGRIKIKNICGYEILVASCPLGTGPSHCHVGREDWAVYLTHIAPGASESMVASDGRQQTPIMACKGPASSVRVTIMGMGKGQCLGQRK